MKKNLAAGFCGILFGLGLTIANMINPTKIQNFLDLLGNWDPSLLVVLLAAVTISFIGYHYIFRLPKPAFDKTFHLPANRRINASLIVGASLFGIGWGLSGYCPGPAFSALALGILDPVYFIGGMLAGEVLWSIFNLLITQKNRDPSDD